MAIQIGPLTRPNGLTVSDNMKLAGILTFLILVGCGGQGSLGTSTPTEPIQVRKLTIAGPGEIYLMGVSNDGNTIIGSKHKGLSIKPILMKNFIEHSVGAAPFQSLVRLSPSGHYAVGSQAPYQYYLWQVGTSNSYRIPISTYADQFRVSNTGTVEGRWSMPPDGFSATFHFRQPDQFDHSTWPPPDPFETPIPEGFSKKLVIGFSTSKTAAFGHVERPDGSWEACIWLPNLGPRVLPDAPENDFIQCRWASDDGTRAYVDVALRQDAQVYYWVKGRGFIPLADLVELVGGSRRSLDGWYIGTMSANGRYLVLSRSTEDHYWIHVP